MSAEADAKELLNRASQLNGRKATLETSSVELVRREAESTYAEAERTITKLIDGEPWYMTLVPVYMLAAKAYSRSRYKDAIQKLQYAKGWLDTGKAAKSDDMRKIAYKQSYSDSAHAIQIAGQELLKGSNLDSAIDTARDKVRETAEGIRADFVVGAVIVGGILLLINKKQD